MSNYDPPQQTNNRTGRRLACGLTLPSQIMEGAPFSNNWAPLLVAAAGNGDVEAIRELLAKGADVDAHEGRGWTALKAAALRGNVSSIKVLVANGADVDAGIEDGITALIVAAEYRQESAIKTLLDMGADVDAPPAGWRHRSHDGGGAWNGVGNGGDAGQGRRR